MYCRGEEAILGECTFKKMNGLQKKLWKGLGPLDGFKEPGDYPEKDISAYRTFVNDHKSKYEKE